ncbi:hypothetical protein RhiirA4_480189 [Rhizophagus irregularis]|uniref:F-box domain-containing protein n=1 Tax=Rhizophagus irregularis TaxID=588596 RepID=A0A2I1HHJ3_9GLOM|nr:hypothetical protein RhiirA4_480189 [Rhizophagus irregularis]
MYRLPADCLNEIFKYLEDDKITLNSCILINRLWCQISIRILWRNVNDYSTSNFSTLIACLPSESKNILNKQKIIISTPTLEFPTFNYATFCKILSVNQVHEKIMELFKNQHSLSRYKIKKNTRIVVQEIFKMLMNQTSLKSLDYVQMSNVNYNVYPNSKDYFKNLSELICSSNLSPEFFCHLSQICHNIQSLTIKPKSSISNGLTDLISVQRNLKYFELYYYLEHLDYNEKKLIPLLIKNLPDSLPKLKLHMFNYISLSLIARFSNLQELELSSNYDEDVFQKFEYLQYVIFPQLRSFKIRYGFPRYEHLIKFLENNGKNLKELNLFDISCESDDSLNLAIAKYCSNLKKLSTGFKYNELETLKIVFNSCQYLESISIWCGSEYFDEKEALEAVLKYSQNIVELILYFQFDIQSKLLSKELETFLINWKNRIPQKSLSLVIVSDDGCRSLDKCNKNMKIIEKYIELGVIKKFSKLRYL